MSIMLSFGLLALFLIARMHWNKRYLSPRKKPHVGHLMYGYMTPISILLRILFNFDKIAQTSQMI